MWAEGVRCYIYNRAGNESTGDKFIKTEDGYEAIDFLGENGGMEMASLVSEDNISYETAFGEVDSIFQSPSYPFEINGNTKYWVSIKGFGTQSDLEELDEWLNADHGINLAGIIEKYWGTDQLQRVRHDANLLFCVEPLQIVPSVCDDGDMETDFSVWQETYDVDCYTYKYGSVFDSDTEIIKNCKNGYEYDRLDMVDNIEKHHSFEYIEIGSEEYYDLKEAFAQKNITEDSIINEEMADEFKGWYVERITWTEQEQINHTQRYKYIYGTARWLCDNSATSTTELEHGSMVLSELGVPTYYNVPQWSANDLAYE